MPECSYTIPAFFLFFFANIIIIINYVIATVVLDKRDRFVVKYFFRYDCLTIITITVTI